MPITLLVDHLDKNRVFIDTTLKCSGGCLYCYASDFETKGSITRTYFDSGECLAQVLSREPDFKAGMYGTAISLGCYADPFHQDSVAITKKLLPHLLALGNPIQLASKCFVGDQEIAFVIAANQHYPGQFTLFVTMTTFAYAAKLEPGAPAPEDRLKVIDAFQAAGVNTAIFIKPLLPGITEREGAEFARAFQQHCVQNCVIGLFYANKRIIKAFEQAELPLLKSSAEDVVGHHFPNDTQHILSQQNSDKLRDDFYNQLVTCINQQHSSPTNVFKTSLCVVAHRLNIPDPMRTWRRYPDLCVNCQDCEKIVTGLDPHLSQRYG